MPLHFRVGATSHFGPGGCHGVEAMGRGDFCTSSIVLVVKHGKILLFEGKDELNARIIRKAGS